MKKKTIALGVISILAAQLSLAAPHEKVVLNTGAVIEGGKTFKISLKPLSDQSIYYDVTCDITNSSSNNAVPFAFYPEKGAIGKTYVNDKLIGEGESHVSTNLNQGTYKLSMTHVNRHDNTTLEIENGATDKSDALLLVGCEANSKN